MADSVNAMANSPYWSESVIIITYDESDGLYDHQPEKFRTYGPDGRPETAGPRIPTIVISPYAAAHSVSHVYSEHSSVIKFINSLSDQAPSTLHCYISRHAQRTRRLRPGAPGWRGRCRIAAARVDA